MIVGMADDRHKKPSLQYTLQYINGSAQNLKWYTYLHGYISNVYLHGYIITPLFFIILFSGSRQRGRR